MGRSCCGGVKEMPEVVKLTCRSGVGAGVWQGRMGDLVETPVY